MADRLATIDMGRKVGGGLPYPFPLRELDLIQHKVAWVEAYLRAKWHLDPYSRLATVHQRHRQTERQDRQRSDSIGRTVLQTVAQKRVSP